MPEILLLKLEAGILVPEHTVELMGTVIWGSGLIVMVKLEAVPAQPFENGVTVMVETMGEVVLFMAGNTGKLPVPFDASPIAEFELIQVYVVPEILLLKLLTGTNVPLQTAKSAGTTTTGSGFTVIVKVAAGPLQLFKVGITVIVAVIGVTVLFKAVKAGILSIPAAASPIAG